MPQEWTAAVNQIPPLSHLKSISLRYTSYCNSPIVPAESSEEREVLERVNLRQQYLELLFHIMAECNATNETKITSLTIKNLQNYSFALDSTIMTSALAYLAELNIRVCTEAACNDHNSIDYPDIHTFWPYLVKTWLQPLSCQIKTLSLYCDDPWGLIPKLDCIKDVYFPKLQSLSIGQRVLAYDWELDWIVKHKTLHSLRLQDCAIVCALRLGHGDWLFNYFQPLTTLTVPASSPSAPTTWA